MMLSGVDLVEILYFTNGMPQKLFVGIYSFWRNSLSSYSNQVIIISGIQLGANLSGIHS